MKTILRKLVRLGYRPGMEHSRAARIASINVFLLLSLVLTISFVIAFRLAGSPTVMRALIYVPLILLVLYLHSKHYLGPARVIVSYGFMLMVLTVALLERRTGTEYLLITLGCCSSLVFDKLRNVIFSFLFACACYIFYKRYDNITPFTPNPTVPYAMAETVIAIISGFIILSQSLVFRRLVREYAHKVTSSNQEIQSINEELQAANEELTAFSENLDLMVRQKSAELQAYVDAINLSLYSSVSDIQGNFIMVNEQVVSTFGYSTDELIGKPMRLLTDSYDATEIFHEQQQRLMHGKTWRGEMEYKTKSGVRHWLDCIMIPTEDSHGIIKSFLTLGLPVTERKRHDKLQKDTLTLLESIAFRASHGIRGPLARINGLSNLIRDHLVAPQEFGLIAEKMIACSQELNEATSELVAYVYSHQELIRDNQQSR